MSGRAADGAWRLSSDFEAGIDWTRPAADLAAWIAARPDDRPAFAFLDGFRILVNEARALDETPEGRVGEIVRFDEGLPVVRAGSGALCLTRYAMNVAGDVATLASFLEVCPMAGPLVLTPVPFLDSARSNLWEQRVERWRSREASVSAARAEVSEARRLELLEANRPFFEALVARLGVGPGAQVLDAGCGDGWAARGFRDLGLEVAGFDLLSASVEAARRLTPDGAFSTCDVYELGSRGDLRGRFDLVFCRNLGLAQKIVDWDDPRWVEVGRAMVDLLRPDGVLYWIQMTDCSGRLAVDGFSNVTIDTLRHWFGRHGEVIQATFCGYVSLVVCRREAAARLRARLAAHDAQTVGAVLEARRAEVAAAASLAEPAVREVTRAVYLSLSPFLMLPQERRERGIVIVGCGRLAQLCVEVARHVRLPVLAFVDAGHGVFMDRPVLPLAEALSFDPAGVLLTVPADVGAGTRPCVSLCDGASVAPRPFFLVSGDQDAYIEGVKRDEAAGRTWDVPFLGARDVLRNGSFERWNWRRTTPREWTFGGAPATTGASVASDLRSRGRALALAYGEGTTYFVQRHVLAAGAGEARLGCWIWCDAPGVARVQLSSPPGDAVSAWHPGDGRWHFLVARKQLAGEGWLDAYVQLVGRAQARFDDAVLLIR